MSNNQSMIGETWQFLRERKKWWLLPIIIFFILIAVFIVLTQSSAISPFIYALL